MGIMGYSKNSESVLPLQLNFDSNAQIKKLKKKEAPSPSLSPKCLKKKWSDPVLCPFGFLLGAVFHGKIIEKHREKH